MTEYYPLPAFHFLVNFALRPSPVDTAFQEVSGIGSEVQTEDVVEGGENRYVHRLPASVRHSQLELKRGVAGIDSPLVQWCRSVFEGDFVQPIRAIDVRVALLNAAQEPVRVWTFHNAYPVKWDIESFGSAKNELAIEKIVLNYNDVERSDPAVR